MEWHWGNIVSFLAGLSTVAIAVAALIRSPAALRDWQARQRAEAEAAHEQAENIRLERRRGLSGWSRQGVNTYPAELVTEPGELDQAVRELTSALPTAYVVLRVTGSTEGGSANLAHQLRLTIQAEGFIARSPTTGEAEALEAGLDAMGIPAAVYGRKRRDVATSGAEDTGSPDSG